MKNPRGRLLFSFLVPLSGFADDGWVGNSGAPHIMRGHATIRMRSERVFMMLGKKYTDVDAHFHFVNDGPSTTVRIGFPDSNSSNVGEEQSPALTGFHSWVGGKPVKTRHVQGTVQWWYVKTVHFPAHSAIDIRDRYRVETGLEAFSETRYTSMASYELDTGASWKGKIDRAEIIVSLSPSLPTVKSVEEFEEAPYVPSEKTLTSTIRRDKHVVWVQGMSEPHLRHGQIVFVKDHFKPCEEDNLTLFFNAGHAIQPESH